MPDTRSDTCHHHVRAIIAQVLDLPFGEIKPECRLADNLGAHALEIIDLAIQLEVAFRIRIADDAIEDFLTVDDVIRTVEQMVAAKAGAAA
jgi:acyl carrier protein